MLPSNTRYKINNEVFFYPQKGVLKSCKELNTVKMSASVSICLWLLIENHGTVVTQDKFFAQIQVTRKLIISSNTLAKNISHLRQSLASTGCQYDIIRTIKGQGYLLPAAFPVIRCEDTVLQPPADDEIQLESEITEEYNGEKILSLSTTEIPVRRPLRRYFSLLACALGVGAAMLFFTNDKNSNTPGGYKRFTESDGCTFFFNRDSNSHKEDILALIKTRENFNCQTSPYIYITVYNELHHYSLFQCAEPIEISNEENTCYTTVQFNYRNADAKSE